MVWLLVLTQSSVTPYSSCFSHSEKESDVLLLSRFTYPHCVGVKVSSAGLAHWDSSAGPAAACLLMPFILILSG